MQIKISHYWKRTSLDELLELTTFDFSSREAFSPNELELSLRADGIDLAII